MIATKGIGVAVLFAALVLASPTCAQTVSGHPTITDGDTIRIEETRIRLFGMDAPESHQQCERDGACYPCGQDATAALKAIVADRPVKCEPTGAKTYGRIVAVCSAEGVNLSVEMIRQGWALPYWRYLKEVPALRPVIEYAYQEARENRRGLHQGPFIEPGDWRNKKRRLSCEK